MPKALARFWKSGTSKSRNVESKQISNMGILKIQIHIAQNVGKVWIGRKKTSQAIRTILSMDRKNPENTTALLIFPGCMAGDCWQRSRNNTTLSPSLLLRHCAVLCILLLLLLQLLLRNPNELNFCMLCFSDYMAMSHLFGCMDCLPPQSHFGTWKK